MDKFCITDTVTVLDASGFTKTPEGYLDVNVKTVRTGIQLYDGASLGRPDMVTVKVFRSEEEVFSKDSLETFARLPITDDHPTEFVTSDNWKDLAVGVTGESVLRDGEFMKIGMRITDAATIKAIEDGKREVSAGYQAQIVWGDGVTPEGETYHAIQKNIVANHVAIVDRARAGSEARIGDSAHNWGKPPVNKEFTPVDLIMKMVDGLQVQTTDAGGVALDKLISDKAGLQNSILSTAKTHKDAMDAKDVDLADRDAKIAKLEATQVSDADMDKRVAARASLIADAKLVAPKAVLDGLTTVGIHKAVLTDALTSLDLTDKSDAYMAARFDVLVDAAKEADPLQKVVDGQKPADITNVVDYDGLDKARSNAWKGQK